jgi:hypothetical protein
MAPMLPSAIDVNNPAHFLILIDKLMDTNPRNVTDIIKGALETVETIANLPGHDKKTLAVRLITSIASNTNTAVRIPGVLDIGDSEETFGAIVDVVIAASNGKLAINIRSFSSSIFRKILACIGSFR